MPPPPPLFRRLLPPVLSAVLALAVAVPATWFVAASQAAGPEPAPALTGPYDRDELRAELLAQLPGRDADDPVLLEVRSELETAVGFPPGRYRLHLICGLLRRQGDQPTEMSFVIDAVEQTWRVTLPCPSTPLTIADPLDLTGAPAGAISVQAHFLERRPASFLLLLRLVPATGG